MNRSPMVQGMRCMRVAQPVRTDLGANPGLFSCASHNHAHAPTIQVLPATRRENEILGSRIAAQADQLGPQARGNRYGSSPSVLAEHRNLTGIAILTHVAPSQSAGFRDTHASGVQQLNEYSVAVSVWRFE